MSRRGDRLGVRRFLPAAAVLAAIATAASAAPPPTVDAIVDSYVAARGGLERIRSIQTLRQRGRAIAEPGREALVTRELKRPGKSRFEFTVQGVTGVYVCDGLRGWQVSPFEGDMTTRPLSEDAVTDALEQADIEGPLVDWKSKGHHLELAGREVVGGHDAYKIEITLKSGATRTDYLDVKSHTLVRSDSTRQVRGHAVRIQTSFGDYKKAGGVLFPRSIEVVAAGRPQKLRVVVDSIDVNPAISDARFEMPASAQP